MDPREHEARALARYGTWRALAGSLDDAPVTTVGRRILDKAIETHTIFFGDDWLAKAITKRAGAITSIWDWPLGTPRAVIQALERSARIQLLSEPNAAALSRVTREKIGAASLAHADVVLESAGLGLRANWQVEVEPETQTPRTPDLRFTMGELSYLFEVTTLGFDRHTINAEEFGRNFWYRTLIFEEDHSVELTVTLEQPYLDNDEIDTLFDVLASAAPSVRPGQPRSVKLDGSTVILHEPGGRPDGPTFTGGLLDGDMWHRLGVRLREKADQTAGGEPAWLRIDESAGMFHFTTARHLAPGEQHALLRQNCEAELIDFPHVRGVIISHGAELDLTPDEPSAVMLDRHRSDHWSGSALLDQAICGRRRRRTYVISLEQGERPAMPAASELRPATWYAHERTWLDWAHQRLGLPPVASLVVDPPPATT